MNQIENKNYYYSRINKSLDYINKNLEKEIKIEQLAKLSNFSSYHFQRIFKALTGESPYESLFRLRLEKSVFLLKYRSKLSIKTIAFQSGFLSPENFSRQFKARYKISPSRFRNDKIIQNSRIYQVINPNDFFLCIKESRKKAQQIFNVTVEKLESIPIYFVRAIFGNDGSGLVEKYNELIEWSKINKINYQGELNRFGMSIDNPDVTPANMYRYDFAIRSSKPVENLEHIEMGIIPAAKYATLHCIGKLSAVAQAWDFLYKHWLANSEYMPLHHPALEEFIQGPEEIGWDNFNIKCRIPIIKMK